MAKILGMDLSDDRLISIAADLVDNHNYIGALKMLNKNAGLSGNDEDSLMLYAEIFDDMGLYEKCVNGWFKYMDNSDLIDINECYEGLAMCYMNLGNEHFAAYYYNKLLMETDELDADAREDILRSFLSEGENCLKFAYPPAIADCSEIFKSGIGYMKEGKFELACEVFEKVHEENPKFASARNYIAMCKIISDKTEEAEQECLAILKRKPDDVQALTTLAAVKTEQQKSDEALSLANKLLNLNTTDSDDIYKIATVCCENKLHKQAYDMFCRLGEEYDYDLNVLYFKAISAFNAKMYDESFAAFDKLVTVFPESVTGEYYYKTARKLHEKGEWEELGYFYRLPTELRESSLKVLAASAKLPQKYAKKLSSQVDLSSCILWTFDECEGKGGGDLQLLAAQVAVACGKDEIVRDILLNAFIDGRLKMEMLSLIAERNVFDCFGVVICNVYMRVSTQALDLGRVKRKMFIEAYAHLFAHFAILDDDYSLTFATACEELYARLESEGRLGDVKNTEALCAAIYQLSEVRAADVDGEKIYSFFRTSKSAVDKILYNRRG